MKVLHVSTYDKGGAARAAIRLHQGLLEIGINSGFLFLNKSNCLIPNSQQFLLSENKITVKLKNKAIRLLKEFHLYKDIKAQLLKSRPDGFESFSFSDTLYDITRHPLYKEADIINIHWASDFLDYSSFFKENKKKIIWTLHDMNPFTGGCHYSGVCDGFKSNCNNCPQLHPKDNAFSKRALNSKMKVVNVMTNLTIVAPSTWLFNQSKQSSLFKNLRHLKIPYGLDKNKYKTLDKRFSRELLGLPLNKKIVLFVADSISNKRKGYEILLGAFKQLENRSDVVLCSLGDRNIEGNKSSNLFELGSIYNDELMCAAYSAADVFVIPSLEDNLPNTVLESLMCGTPVIGFPVGGIVDMIEHGINGYLTNDVSRHGLVDAIQIFLTNNIVADCNTIRNNTIAKYDLLIQAESYKMLYSDLIKHK